MTRWRAIITYRSENGDQVSQHELFELFELHDLVEQGPAWQTIKDITVNFMGLDVERELTLEQAARE